MTETEKPRAKPGSSCPLWRRDMSKVCHTCEWWIKVVGKNPQGPETIDCWGCAIRWMPVLMIENSQMQRQTSAEVSDFKNEVVKSARQSDNAREQMIDDVMGAILTRIGFHKNDARRLIDASNDRTGS